jgi:hypothetical protein
MTDLKLVLLILVCITVRQVVDPNPVLGNLLEDSLLEPSDLLHGEAVGLGDHRDNRHLSEQECKANTRSKDASVQTVLRIRIRDPGLGAF